MSGLCDEKNAVYDHWQQSLQFTCDDNPFASKDTTLHNNIQSDIRLACYKWDANCSGLTCFMPEADAFDASSVDSVVMAWTRQT